MNTRFVLFFTLALFPFLCAKEASLPPNAPFLCVSSPLYDCNQNDPSLIFTIDYLFWQVQPGQAGSLYDTYPAIAPSGTYIKDAKLRVLFPDYKPQSGFKLGLGGYLNEQSCSLYAEYTLVYDKQEKGNFSKKAIHAPPYTYNTIKNYFAYVFQRLDLTARREFCLQKQMNTTCAGGLLFSTDEQWLGAITLNYYLPATGFSASVYDKQIQKNQKTFGIGPYVHLDNKLYFLPMTHSKNGSLQFGAGVSLPWTKFQWSRVEDYKNITTATVQSSGFPFISGGENVHNHLWALSPMVELSIGLGWQTLFGECNSHLLSLQAAWETQVWISHDYSISVDKPRNLILQGLTVSASLDF